MALSSCLNYIALITLCIEKIQIKYGGAMSYHTILLISITSGGHNEQKINI